MNVSDAYRQLCERDPRLSDSALSADIALLEERAARSGAAMQQSLPIADHSLLVDDVIRLGQEFKEREAWGDFILARRTVVGLMRPNRNEEPLDFANALGILAFFLGGQSRWAEALAYARECSTFLAPYAAESSGEIAGLYGRALQDSGSYLAELNRLEEAIAAKREAISAYERCLVADDRRRSDVAVTCDQLVELLLQDLRWIHETLPVCERAVELWTELVEEGVAGPPLALALRRRTQVLCALDRTDDALASGLEATDMLRAMAAEDPAYKELFALALDLVSDPLSDAGRGEEALALATEAVRLSDDLKDSLAGTLVRWTYGKRLLEHGHLDRAMEAYLAATQEAPADWLEALAPQVDHLSRLLANHGRLRDAIEVATQLTHLYESLAAADADWIPDHVDALGWLAELEVRCGRREAGLRTAERAVAVAQALPASNSLARALGHLGSCLAEAARHEEAEEASRAALELWQELAAAENPDALINLPTAWNNLGNRLGALGRFEEAAAASQRAVGLYPSDSSHRANALNSFANQVNWLGRPDDARIKAQEAVAIYDGLAEEEPHLLVPLAGVLRNLALYQAALGDLDSAAASAGRSVQISHDLWLIDPEPFEPGLLQALGNQIDYLTATGNFALAARAAALRVEIIESRPHSEPGAELAEALANLGGYLTGMDRIQDAVEVLERAEGLCRDVPTLRAFTLDKLAWCHAQFGQPDEAARLARVGIQLLEPIESDDRNPYLPLLAVLCHDLGDYLSSSARMLEAHGTVGRAIDIRERLVAMDRDLHADSLTASLRFMASVLTSLNRHDQAQELLRRAATLE